MPFALIQNGLVHEIRNDGSFGNLVTLVDVSAVSPAPDVGWSYDGKTFVAPSAPITTAAQLVAYAASARYAKETAGITVGTAPIATDRDSQQAITGMWAAAQIDPTIAVQFKTAGAGFVAIGAAQINRIASAVACYVQACFAAEAQVVSGIAGGTVKATADIDAVFAVVVTSFVGTAPSS